MSAPRILNTKILGKHIFTETNTRKAIFIEHTAGIKNFTILTDSVLILYNSMKDLGVGFKTLSHLISYSTVYL